MSALRQAFRAEELPQLAGRVAERSVSGGGSGHPKGK